MSVLDRILAVRQPGNLVMDVPAWESETGHHSEWASEPYDQYLASSNDIYSAVNFRARHMGGLNLLAYKGRGPEKELRTDGPVPDLLRRVNPFWTFSRLMRQTEMTMGIWGECPWAVEKDRRGNPANLWWLKPTRLHPVPDKRDWLKGFLYEPVDGSPPIEFGRDEIVWLRYPNPIDEYAGLPPLVAARLAADVASASMKSNRNLFTQGMQIGGLLSPKGDKVSFTQTQAEELERLLARRFKGVDKAHRWGVLRFEAEVKALAITPKDAEFVAGLNMTFRQVCRVYGTPSPLLGDLEHATLANLQELDLTFWQHAMVPDANFYAADLEEQLLPLFRRGDVDHLAWDFSQVPALQEAAAAVWDRERQQIEAGAILINEWRKDKGKPPVPWGDVWWAPVNKGPVKDASRMPSENMPEEDRQAALIASFLSEDLSQFLDTKALVSTNGHKEI